MQKKIYIHDELKGETWSQVTKRKVSEELFALFYQCLNKSEIQCYSNDIIKALMAISDNHLVKMRTFKDIAGKNKSIENGWEDKIIYRLNSNGISIEAPTNVINKKPDITLSIIEDGFVHFEWYDVYSVQIRKKLKEPQKVRIKNLNLRHKKLLYQLSVLGCSNQLAIDTIREMSGVNASDSSYRRLLETLFYEKSKLYIVKYFKKNKGLILIYFEENKHLKPIFLNYESKVNEIDVYITNIGYPDEERFKTLVDKNVDEFLVSDSYKKMSIDNTGITLDIVKLLTRKVSNRVRFNNTFVI